MKLYFGLFVLLQFALLSCTQDKQNIDQLITEFKNPPQEARPHVFWYWMNGNISAEGITADLEAMARVGIGGAAIFNIGGQAPLGPVKILSPEWRELMKHAIREAKRLGIEINLNNSMSGWSSSGGPWITPELSMQHITWSEVTIDSDVDKGPIILPKSYSKAGSYNDFAVKTFISATEDGVHRTYYRDIAVLAFPTPLAEYEQKEFDLSSNIKGLDRKLLDAFSDVPQARNWDIDPLPADVEVKLIAVGGKRPFMQWNYTSPVKKRSLQISLHKGRVEGVLKASDDGVTWRDVHVFASRNFAPVSDAFTAEPAKFWRIEFKPDPGVVLTGLRLWEGYRIADYTGKAMFDPFGLDNPGFTNMGASHPDFLSDCVIPQNAIIDLTDKMTKDGTLNWKVPEGRWTILRFGHVPTGSQSAPRCDDISAYECDKLNPKALDVHFANSLQPWFDDPELNDVIKYVHVDSYERGAQNWTAALPEEFKKRKDYDISKWLPVLTGRVIGDVRDSERFLWDFRNVSCGMMHENYFGHMGTLCENAGKQFTCEPYHQSQFNNLTAGSHAHIPMCEAWMGNDNGVGLYHTKKGASPAHLYGKNIVGAEAFTAPGWKGGNWGTDFFDMKVLGDALLCGGVNRFMYHVYVHQPFLDIEPGLTLAVWGSHFERTNTWWEKMPGFNTYVSRCQYMLQQGIFVGDVLYSCGENNPNDHVQPEGALSIPSGYDYDVCDPKAIYERISVKNGKLMLPDGLRYRLLVLPDDPTMTLKMLSRLDEMVSADAVIVGRTKPKFSPSLADKPEQMEQFQKLADALWDGGKIISDKTVAEALRDIAPPDFEARGAKDFVRHIHRFDKGTDIYFIASSANVAQQFEAVFRTKADVSPILMDAVTGEVRALPEYRIENGRTIIPMNLDPKQSYFIVFGDEAPEVYGKQNFEETKPVQEIQGSWLVEFNPEWGGPSQAVTFAELSDWSEHTDPAIKYYSGTAVYHKTFDCNFTSKKAKTFLSLGKVKNVAEVKLNGQALGIVWCAPWRVTIPNGLLKAKGNKLEIELVNLWPNRMIGDEQLPEDSEFVHSSGWDKHSRAKTMQLKSYPDWFKNKTKRPSGRYTFSSLKLWEKDSPLLPSGLLGPVRLQKGD